MILFAAGSGHEATRTVIYLLNDLEISLQLGQFEFGAAQPVDNRSSVHPFSQLSMHEKALLEYNQSVTRKQRPPSQSSRSVIIRPQSAFNVEKPRNESRLQKAFAKRPKTAPTLLQRPKTAPIRDTSCDTGLGDGDAVKLVTSIKVVDSQKSSVASSPRTFRSYTNDCTSVSRMTDHSIKQSVLKKYYPEDRHDPKLSKQGRTPTERVASSMAKVHKCHDIGAHTIHEKLRTTTLGPNSSVISVAGYTRPSRIVEPLHKAAWYHSPNHYITYEKPHINPRVYAQRKHKLMHQRSHSAPVRSRYLQDHTNAIKHIAKHESAYIFGIN